MLVYHLCPLCKGQGIVSKPPWVAGDVDEWVSSNAGPYTCRVCQGAGIIPAPPQNSEDQEVYYGNYSNPGSDFVHFTDD
jgi:hypothetical protein